MLSDMRAFSLLILLVIAGIETHAQSSAYTYTPEGKLLFANVIEKENQTHEALYALAVQEFSDGKKKKIKKNEEENNGHVIFRMVQEHVIQ